jgi:hypothetical protein
MCRRVKRRKSNRFVGLFATTYSNAFDNGVKDAELLGGYFISVLAVLVVGMLAFTFFNGRNVGKDIYYVTPTGKKFHTEDCKYIEGKDDLKALTREECILQGYYP